MFKGVTRTRLEARFKALVVWLILNGKAEEALELLTSVYEIETPAIKVGLPQRRRTRTYGCYNLKNKTIYVLNSDMLKEPFVILHEFYHHLRTTVDSKHKGTENYADKFANDFIQTYNRISSQKH